jgi:integrase
MLTDADCRNASCAEGQAKRRLTDSGGLFLEVTPNGSKRWFWRYAMGGKPRSLPLGSYCKPGNSTVLMSLKAARAARDEARKLRQAGVDPIQQRRADRLADDTRNATSFELVAREFHATQREAWSPGHADKWIRTSELHLFPHLGTLSLTTINAPMLLGVLRLAERKGILSTAHDLRTMAGQVFRYGIQTGRCAGNPAADLGRAIKPHVQRHFPAIVDPSKAGELLRSMSAYTGTPATRGALLLSALLFQRPGNIRAMEWAWVDLANAVLTIPPASMKRRVEGKLNGRPHLVPLARQALAILAELQPLTGHGQYVFPSARTGERPMSDGTLNAALRRMDYGSDEHVSHGFRAMARTLIAEKMPDVEPDVVEAQLAHGKSGPLGMAYDRSTYMDQRRQLMQVWADFVDRLRDGGQVIPMPTKTA